MFIFNLSQSEKSPKSPKSKSIFSIIGIVIAIPGSLVALYTLWKIVWVPKPPEIACDEVQIADPQPQQKIKISSSSSSRKIEVKGKKSDLKEILHGKYLLWVIGQPENSSRYFPFKTPAKINNDGTWVTSGFTGYYESPKKYTFSTIIIDKKYQTSLNNGAINTIPNFALVCSSEVTVNLSSQ